MYLGGGGPSPPILGKQLINMRIKQYDTILKGGEDSELYFISNYRLPHVRNRIHLHCFDCVHAHVI